MSSDTAPDVSLNVTPPRIELQDESLWHFIGQSWSSRLDFRLKLLIVLLIWLVCSVIFLRFSWKIYGPKLDTLLNSGTLSAKKKERHSRPTTLNFRTLNNKTK